MESSSRIIFADEKTKSEFESLKSDELMRKSLEKAFTDIERNAFCGIQIPKRIIPSQYIRMHSIKNLWKYNLPNAWRLLYSVESDGIIILAIILEWMSRKDYERVMKY